MKPRGICRDQNFNDGMDRPYSPHNNKEDCETDEGTVSTCMYVWSLSTTQIYNVDLSVQSVDFVERIRLYLCLCKPLHCSLELGVISLPGGVLHKTKSMFSHTDNPGMWFEEYAYIEIDSVATTEVQCNNREANDGISRVWAPAHFGENPSCLVLASAPACEQVGWSRVNHLGNGRDGVPLNYTWKLPYFPSGNSKLAVLRMRYGLGRLLMLYSRHPTPTIKSPFCESGGFCTYEIMYRTKIGNGLLDGRPPSISLYIILHVCGLWVV